MTFSNNTYTCEECDMTFNNENDFVEHKNYAKFRRGILLAIVVRTKDFLHF